MKIVVKYIIILMCLSIAVSKSTAQTHDKHLVKGKLDNGFTYYIHKTEEGNQLVSFFLLQNVGSIVEEDDEIGMAHFLEHMAFNASNHFPKGVMKFLREQHMFTFSASTGLNETLYNINDIPLDNRSLIDSCLLVVKDWCGGLSLTEKDVEKERSIVTEEWRTTESLGRRMRETTAPVIYNNSKYAYRNIIGTCEAISNFKANKIKDFYNKWYRPDLQCLIIIGDIDPQEYEKKVKSTFSSLQMPAVSPKREDIEIKPNTNPLFFSFNDKENTYNSFGLYQRIPKQDYKSANEIVKTNLFVRIFNELANRRLSQIKNSNKEEFLASTLEFVPLVRNYNSCSWEAVPFENMEKEALSQLLTIREEISRLGFTEEEFEKVQKEEYEQIDKLLKEEILGVSENFMEIYRQNFLYNYPIVNMRDELEENREQLVEMTVDDLNSWIKSWMTNQNLSLIVYSHPHTSTKLTSDFFLKTLDNVKNMPISREEKTKMEAPLIDFEIKKGNIAEVTSLAEFEAEEWTLSNGTKLIYKYLPAEDKKKDIFYFVASSMGGRSVVTDKDIPSFVAMQNLIMKSGLHKFTRNQLQDVTSDMDFDINLTIDDYTEGVGGYSNVKDAESFFQYIHLLLEKPRFDKKDFEKYKQKKKYAYLSSRKSSLTQVRDSIQQLLYPSTARNRTQDIAFFDDMEYEKLSVLFKDRFSNAQDFTFCIVGALPKDEAKLLSEKYIASLTSKKGEKEMYVLHDINSAEPVIEREFWADMPGEVGIVDISFYNKSNLNKKDEAILSIFGEILQKRLFDIIREREGGSYAVNAATHYDPIALTGYLNINFETQRSKVNSLKQMIYAELSSIQKIGITEDEVKKIIVPKLVDYNVLSDDISFEDNSPEFWLGALNLYVESGGRLKTDKLTSEKEILENITKNDIRAFAQRFFASAYKRDIVIKSVFHENKKWSNTKFD